MASHGADETERLKSNVQDQLQRLLQQLKDLEELRVELDDDEYEETHRDTIEQLEEFDGQLKKMMDGDMSLVSALGSIKLQLRAAIAASVQTANATGAFAQREAAALRAKLAKLREDVHTRRMAQPAFQAAAVEVLISLKRLGEALTPEEQAIIEGASGDVKKRFATAAGDAVSEGAVLNLAAKAAAGAGAGR